MVMLSDAAAAAIAYKDEIDTTERKLSRLKRKYQYALNHVPEKELAEVVQRTE